MALLPSIPENKQLTPVQGSSTSFKFIPKNADGTVKDCTGMTSVSVQLFFDSTSQLAAGSPLGLTVTLADATGISATMDATVNATAVSTLGYLRGAYIAEIGDGTDTINGAYGIFQVTPTGF